jgi:hypothetical protein
MFFKHLIAKKINFSIHKLIVQLYVGTIEKNYTSFQLKFYFLRKNIPSFKISIFPGL